VVVQYPTAAEARQEAGVSPGAFSWGRFLISGHVEVVEEIKRRL
jgi:hypothetical protein